jgi:hypothetical protein
MQSLEAANFRSARKMGNNYAYLISIRRGSRLSLPQNHHMSRKATRDYLSRGESNAED